MQCVNCVEQLLVDSFDICHANMLCSYSIFMLCPYSIFMLCSLVKFHLPGYPSNTDFVELPFFEKNGDSTNRAFSMGLKSTPGVNKGRFLFFFPW